MAWKKPYRLNITEAVKPGQNTAQIKVTNLWVNRFMSNTQPKVKNKITFTTMPFYQADPPLLLSGLMSLVRII